MSKAILFNDMRREYYTQRSLPEDKRNWKKFEELRDKLKQQYQIDIDWETNQTNGDTKRTDASRSGASQYR